MILHCSSGQTACGQFQQADDTPGALGAMNGGPSFSATGGAYAGAYGGGFGIPFGGGVFRSGGQQFIFEFARCQL
jgi:hypothetical protein